MRTCHLTHALDVGGVEQTLLQLTSRDPHAEIVALNGAGVAADQAKERGGPVLDLGVGGPRLPRLLSALVGCDVAHIHTINHDPLPALAAQLAGVPLIVQTLHDFLAPRSEELVDPTLCVSAPSQAMLGAPRRSTVVPNGVEAPPELPPFQPWHRSGRPARVLELRRPGKEMAVTLDDMAATGALAGRPLDLRVAGLGPGEGPRGVQHLGVLRDPTGELARADVVVHGSARDTFGRVLYEAMAWGAAPLATPLPAFTASLPAGACVYLEDATPRAAAQALQALLDRLEADPARHEASRRASHAWIRETHAPAVLAQRRDAVLARLHRQPQRERTFRPADLRGGSLPDLARLLDAILYDRGGLDLTPLLALRGPPAGLAAFVAVSSRRLHNPAVEVRMMEQAIALLGPRPVLCAELGEALLRAERPDEAVLWWMHAARARPLHAWRWVRIVSTLRQRGREADARAALSRARRVLPTDPRLLALG